MAAKNGDTVKVHYTGKFENGNVFDTSDNREPLQFIIGDSQVISGFEEAVVGMKPGESKTAKIPVEKGYGSYRKEMVQVVDRDQFPPDFKPEIGQRFQFGQSDGRVIVAEVTNVSETQVTLDANHPLAGKNLVFEIELVEIL